MNEFLEHLIVPEISLLEKIARPIIVYLFLLIGLRVAGKRELAQVNPMDLIVLLTLSNTVQNAIIGSDNSVLGGIIGATTLLLVNYVVVRFLYKHERLDRLIEGDPTMLIENGHILQDKLEHELITRNELESAAHKQGFASLAEIERAVLEPGGSLTFVARKPDPELVRHQQVLERLDILTRELAQFRARLPGTSGA